MTLQEYANASVALVGLSDATEIYAALAAMGISKEVWDQTQQDWGPKLADPEVLAQFHALYNEALNSSGPSFELPSFETYIAGAVALSKGKTMEEVAAGQGLEMKAFMQAGQTWMERIEGDPWLKTHYALMVQKGIVSSDGFEREVDRWIPGQMVRARRCPFCQATKDTPPATAYIYCDYCGRLFDYDSSKSTEDPRSLDSDDVEVALNEVTIAMQKAAFEANDKAEYARILNWKNGLMMEVCPKVYSPRIGDPQYRQRLLEGVLVPQGVETRFDEPYVLAGRAVSAANEQANATLGANGLNLQRVLEALQISLSLFAIEADILERVGVFERHPDGLDKELFLYINRSCFVRPWLGYLSGTDGDQLLAAAGVKAEYMSAVEVDLVTRGCGQCGAKVLTPPSATTSMCESCGHMLSKQVCGCPKCGARIGVPAETQTLELKCGFCDSQFRLA